MNDVAPWSVKGVDPECREAAKVAARKAGMTLGAWLNRAIMLQAASELSGDTLRRQNEPTGSWLPALPTEKIVQALEAFARELREENRRLAEQNRKLAEETLALMARGISEISKDLEGMRGISGQLAAAQEAARKLEELGDVGSRVGAAESKADRATLAVPPLERALSRLSERLDRLDEPAPVRERRRGLFARLLGL
jgi:localization factor PodJL